MKPKRTWVLIADGARARVLVNEGPGKGLKPALDKVFEVEHPPTRELGTDRPGRAKETADGSRHAMEPRVDWHRQAKTDFARELAKVLDAAAERNAFDRLVLVAPPRTLGDLRAALDRKTVERVTAQLSKDLTQIPDHQLAPHLASVLVL